MTNDEMTYAAYLDNIIESYTGQHSDQHGNLSAQIPLNFSRDQRLFQLQPGQPPRTAKIGLNWGDQIYVNLKVINDPTFS